MTRIVSRMATEHDLDFIGHLSDRAFSVYGNYEEIVTNWFYEPGVIATVAMEKAVPVGFAMLYLGKEGSQDSPKGELLAIAVTPEYQDRGIGTALLTHIESLALNHGASELQLHTAHDNISARSFFQKAGFKIIGSRRRYYPRGQPALVMSKVLRQ